MAVLYKLTDANGRTRGGMQWGENVTHEVQGSATQGLCSDGWIHAYEHPLLAVLLNPIHGGFTNPQLWEAEGEIGKRDGQLKCGCRKLTTLRPMAVPVVTTEQRVRFGIMCAREVVRDERWLEWADRWLSRRDRSEEVEAAAAEARASAARAAWARAEARAAWAAAAWAAEAAAWAAEAAAWAAEAAAEAAAWAAEAAGAAAEAAAEAAARAAGAGIDLIALAQKAMEEAPCI